MAEQEEVAVPIFSSLEHVYGEGSQLEEATRRFDVLKAKFNQVFGATPQLFARSPGKISVVSSSGFGKNETKSSLEDHSLTFGGLVSN